MDVTGFEIKGMDKMSPIEPMIRRKENGGVAQMFGKSTERAKKACAIQLQFISIYVHTHTHTVPAAQFPSIISFVTRTIPNPSHLTRPAVVAARHQSVVKCRVQTNRQTKKRAAEISHVEQQATKPA